MRRFALCRLSLLLSAEPKQNAILKAHEPLFGRAGRGLTRWPHAKDWMRYRRFGWCVEKR